MPAAAGLARLRATRQETQNEHTAGPSDPLDPGHGGRSISARALGVGDILLSTTGEAISVAIRKLTRSEISHTTLYVGGGQVIEAIGSGVELRSITDAIADDSVVVAVRHPHLTSQEALQVRDYAGTRLAMPSTILGYYAMVHSCWTASP